VFLAGHLPLSSSGNHVLPRRLSQLLYCRTPERRFIHRSMNSEELRVPKVHFSFSQGLRREDGREGDLSLWNCAPRRFSIIIIIGSTALNGPWSPQANVVSDLYPVHPPASFYNPLSLRLPLSCTSARQFLQPIFLASSSILYIHPPVSTTHFPCVILYPVHPPASFYNPLSLRLPLPRQ
jgi:hypothetical protein